MVQKFLAGFSLRNAILSLLLFFFFVAPLTTACTPADAPGASQPVTDALNVVKKGLTAAHTAHGFAADLCKALAQSGVLHGSSAATAKEYLDQSEAALVVADDAVAVGDVAKASVAIDKANALLTEIHALTGK